MSTRETTYVEAARAIGARHVDDHAASYLFGNVVQSVPVIGTLNAADAIGTLAALGFLGLGIQPNEASEWGYDLSRALDDAQAGVWWPALWPGLAIILLITASPSSARGSTRPSTRPCGAADCSPSVRCARHGTHQRVGGEGVMTEIVERDEAPGAAGEPVIEVRDLRVWYGTERGAVRAVDGVSFDLARGRDPRAGGGVRAAASPRWAVA